MVKSLRLIISLLAILGFISLTSNFAFADDNVVVDRINILVPSSCTLYSTGNDSHNATIANGLYVSDIGTTTVKTICNDKDGFAIYAIGYTDNEYGNTVLAAASGTASDIVTGTATSAGNPDVSNWAMKLTAASSPTPTYPITIESGFNSYHTVPSSYTKVASRSSGTDAGASAEGSTLTTTYAVYISAKQSSTTYNGKVKYTLVHPATNVPNEAHTCGSNKICYWPNAGDMTVGGVGVVDTMGDQTIGASDTSAILWASNFQRTGYGFAGWSDAYDWVVNEGSESNPDAHIYGPNETITFTAGQYQGTDKGLSLYAVWVKPEGFLQDWQGCSNLDTGEVTALIDARDNDAYAVAKLVDDKCWMIESLRLDNTASGNSDGSLAQGYAKSSTYGDFIGLAAPENSTANYNSISTANSLYSTDGSTASTIKGGDSTNYNRRFPRYNNANTASPVANMTATNQNIYSYGNRYTWAAVVADISEYTSTSYSVTTTSICPSGWRVPTGGDVTNTINVSGNPSTFSDFYNLGYEIMGFTAEDEGTNPPHYLSTPNANGDDAYKAFRKYPNNFFGNYTDYYASTVYGARSAYSLDVGSTGVYPGTNWGSRSYADYVRCVVDE